jgi:hypothetical protein
MNATEPAVPAVGETRRPVIARTALSIPVLVQFESKPTPWRTSTKLVKSGTQRSAAEVTA